MMVGANWFNSCKFPDTHQLWFFSAVIIREVKQWVLVPISLVSKLDDSCPILAGCCQDEVLVVWRFSRYWHLPPSSRSRSPMTARPRSVLLVTSHDSWQFSWCNSHSYNFKNLTREDLLPRNVLTNYFLKNPLRLVLKRFCLWTFNQPIEALDWLKEVTINLNCLMTVR